MADKEWYRIDNAGVLYTALQSDTYSPVYRFSAVLKEPVDPITLQRAIQKTMPRFPTLNVRLRKGAFWHYLEPDRRPGPFLREDIRNCCQPMDMSRGRDRLVRFYYYDKRVSIECFHALSDGVGAMTFFKTLLAVYFRELGESVPNTHGVLDVEAPPDEEESEDAYRRYGHGKTARGAWQKTAYCPTGEPEPYYTLNITQGLLSVAQLKEKARGYNASITEYLAAVLIQILLERQRGQRPGRERPVALAIPINLRPFFPSRTLRNFFLTARPCIDPALGEQTLEEIIEQVHLQLRLEMSKPLMRAKITGNVNFQRNPILKLVPSVIKDPVMALSYKLVGVRPYSMTYTNPGIFSVPEEMARHIHHMEAVLGQPYSHSVNCASVSFGDIMAISFAGDIKERDIEREFFRFLVRQGLSVTVQSNRLDEEGR